MGQQCFSCRGSFACDRPSHRGLAWFSGTLLVALSLVVLFGCGDNLGMELASKRPKNPPTPGDYGIDGYLTPAPVTEGSQILARRVTGSTREVIPLSAWEVALPVPML